MTASILGALPHQVWAMAFVVAAIDATGLPFPGRFLLVLTGARAGSVQEAGVAILAAAAGALVGDHLLYAAGRLGGKRLLSLQCRLSGASARCLRRAREQFERFGPLAILFGRFVASIRLLAAGLAGSGAIPYVRFLAFDLVGALIWAGSLVGLGFLVGRQSASFLDSYGSRVEVLLALIAVGSLGVGLYRWWQRGRHGSAMRARPAPAR
jgi:membrane protein DedA with SNARE-associated domain